MGYHIQALLFFVKLFSFQYRALDVIQLVWGWEWEWGGRDAMHCVSTLRTANTLRRIVRIIFIGANNIIKIMLVYIVIRICIVIFIIPFLFFGCCMRICFDFFQA
jgi:hypothetical protein